MEMLWRAGAGNANATNLEQIKIVTGLLDLVTVCLMLLEEDVTGVKKTTGTLLVEMVASIVIVIQTHHLMKLAMIRQDNAFVKNIFGDRNVTNVIQIFMI